MDLNTRISISQKTNLKTKANTYRITNPQTGEFVDVFDIVENDTFFKFNAITSSGVKINDLKYYGDNFISSLQNFTNSKSQQVAVVNKTQCGPCFTFVVGIVMALIDAAHDTPQEVCKNAMNNLKCSGGTNTFMEFNDSWFSTTCNVGCR